MRHRRDKALLHLGDVGQHAAHVAGRLFERAVAAVRCELLADALGGGVRLRGNVHRALAVRLKSRRIWAATTAKPRPVLPAHAASQAALMDRNYVCRATAAMTSTNGLGHFTPCNRGMRTRSAARSCSCFSINICKMSLALFEPSSCFSSPASAPRCWPGWCACAGIQSRKSGKASSCTLPCAALHTRCFSQRWPAGRAKRLEAVQRRAPLATPSPTARFGSIARGMRLPANSGPTHCSAGHWAEDPLRPAVTLQCPGPA